MIFVDTSVWIEFLRNKRIDISYYLQRLIKEDKIAITGINRLEILCGASKKNFAELADMLSAVPTFYPDENAFRVLENHVFESVKIGYRFGIADLMIAEIVKRQKGVLWSLDADFIAMEKMGFLKLYIV